MDLGELAAEGRDADRVLEQPAGIRVVTVGRRRIGPQGSVAKRSRDDSAQRVVVHLADEELEKSFELVRVSPQPRRQPRWVDTFRRLERPHLDLELVAEPLHAAEHADGVPGLEAPV